MDGVSFHLDVNGLAGVLTRINRLGALNKHELMEGLARLGQQQTRKRIEVEKKGPKNENWSRIKTWSDIFNDRHPGTGREALFDKGAHLWRSIDYIAGENEARWGSGWIGARPHQLGAIIKPKGPWPLRFRIGGHRIEQAESELPPRPYLGLSAANEAEMVRTAERFISMVAPS